MNHLIAPQGIEIKEPTYADYLNEHLIAPQGIEMEVCARKQRKRNASNRTTRN